MLFERRHGFAALDLGDHGRGGCAEGPPATLASWRAMSMSVALFGKLTATKSTLGC
jgi:hypothetical protein